MLWRDGSLRQGSHEPLRCLGLPERRLLSVRSFLRLPHLRRLRVVSVLPGDGLLRRGQRSALLHGRIVPELRHLAVRRLCGRGEPARGVQPRELPMPRGPGERRDRRLLLTRFAEDAQGHLRSGRTARVRRSRVQPCLAASAFVAPHGVAQQVGYSARSHPASTSASRSCVPASTFRCGGTERCSIAPECARSSRIESARPSSAGTRRGVAMPPLEGRNCAPTIERCPSAPLDATSPRPGRQPGHASPDRPHRALRRRRLPRPRHPVALRRARPPHRRLLVGPGWGAVALALGRRAGGVRGAARHAWWISVTDTCPIPVTSSETSRVGSSPAFPEVISPDVW